MPTGLIEFLPTVQRIRHGVGVLADALREEQRLLGAQRPFVVLARALVGTDVEAAVRSGLPGAAVHSGSFEHVPPEAVIAAARAAAMHAADLIVAIGGGSAIDTAKGLRFALAAGITAASDLLPAMAGPSPTAQGLPQVSVPTTLSGAEYTRSFSATDRLAADKRSHTATALASTAIVYDPEVTRATPDSLWLGSGLVALDHALEVYVCNGAHPVADVLKERSARLLWTHLPATGAASTAPAMRLECQLAAWMVDHSPLRTRAAGAAGTPWSHLLAYDLAAMTGLSYALTAAVTLPNALRVLAETPACAARIHALERALGLPGPLPESVEAWIRQLGLPTSAEAAGVDVPTLRRVADAAARRGGVDPAHCARVLGVAG